MEFASPDVLLMIFSHLGQLDLYACVSVCHTWRRLLTEGRGALLEKKLFSRDLLEKDIRLDTLREWRLLVTPMIQRQISGAHEWVYGHAYCHRPQTKLSGVIALPFCTRDTQNTIYRRGVAGGLAPPSATSGAVDAPDMPLLHQRHRMQTPVYVCSVRVVLVLKMCLQNYTKMYIGGETQAALLDEMFELTEQITDDGLRCTRLVVHMRHANPQTTQNTRVMFAAVARLTDKFPAELLHKKWIETEALVSRLPSARVHGRAPIAASQKVARIMPYSKEVTMNYVRSAIEEMQRAAAETISGWMHTGFPWDGVQVTACIAVRTLMSGACPAYLGAPAQAASILLNRHAKFLDAYWKSMRYKGHRPASMTLDTALLASVTVVFYYFCKFGQHQVENCGAPCPGLDYVRVRHMQRLTEAVHRGRFPQGSANATCSITNADFAADFAKYLNFLHTHIPQAIGYVYTRYLQIRITIG